MRCLTRAIERDDNGQTHCDLRRGHGNDEKDKNLRVVVGNPGGVEAEAREGNEGEVGRVQHQLERHEDDDDVAAQKHARETDREKQTANDEIMAQCYHAQRSSRLLRTITPMVATKTSTPMIWNGKL